MMEMQTPAIKGYQIVNYTGINDTFYANAIDCLIDDELNNDNKYYLVKGTPDKIVDKKIYSDNIRIVRQLTKDEFKNALDGTLNCKKYTIKYVKGKPEGRYIRRSPNDIVIYDFNYSMGKRDGECITYHNNGNIHKIENYTQGVLHGAYKEYGYYGSLSVSCTYNNGKKHGPYKEYGYDKKLEIHANYHEDKLHGNYKKYSNDKLILDVNLHMGLLHGPYYKNDEENKEIIECNYNMGKFEDVYKSYYEKDKLKTIVTYVNGIRQGTLQTYYYDGKPHVEAQINDVYNGMYRSWYENGEREYICSYKNGKLHGPYEYYRCLNDHYLSKDQKKKKSSYIKCTFVDGKVDGLLEYIKNGKTYTDRYEMGKCTTPWHVRLCRFIYCV